MKKRKARSKPVIYAPEEIAAFCIGKKLRIKKPVWNKLLWGMDATILNVSYINHFECLLSEEDSSKAFGKAGAKYNLIYVDSTEIRRIYGYKRSKLTKLILGRRVK